MSLLFFDGFDDRATAQVVGGWDVVSSSSPSIVSDGRHGGKLCQFLGTKSLSRWLPPGTTYVIGGAIRPVSYSSISAAYLFSLNESLTTHLALRLDTSGVLSVSRQSTVLGTVPNMLLGTNQWYYVEFKATVHDTAGQAEVRVNGVSVLTLTNVDTRQSGTGIVNNIMLGGSGNVDWQLDDFYILDPTGDTNNDFLGDVKVETLWPVGNGNSSQLTGSDANSTDNYLLVDDPTPDDDTTYVESATPGNKDTYQFNNLSDVPDQIFGVQTCLRSRKTDAGTRSICDVARINNTDYDGPTVNLGDSYSNVLTVKEINPVTGQPWTYSDINNAEFGIKVIS